MNMDIKTIEKTVTKNYERIARLLWQSREVMEHPTIWVVPTDQENFASEPGWFLVTGLRDILGLSPVEATDAFIWVFDNTLSVRELDPYDEPELQELVLHPMPGWARLIYVGDYEFGLADVSRPWAEYVGGRNTQLPKPMGPQVLYASPPLPTPRLHAALEADRRAFPTPPSAGSRVPQPPAPQAPPTGPWAPPPVQIPPPVPVQVPPPVKH